MKSVVISTCINELVSLPCIVFVGCDNNAVLVKAFTTGSDGHSLALHDGKPTAIRASSNGHHCLVATDRGTLYTYNFRTKKVLHTYECSQGQSAITSCHVTKDENFVFTCTADTVRVWTFFKECTRLVVPDDHKNIVTCIAVSRDGKSQQLHVHLVPVYAYKGHSFVFF